MLDYVPCNFSVLVLVSYEQEAGISSFVLALGLCSLRVKKINILSLLWAESLTQEMQIPSVFYLLLHTFLDVWRDQHSGCSSRSQQSLTHNPKLIFLAGQIKPVASGACPANTDLTQITAQPVLIQPVQMTPGNGKLTVIIADSSDPVSSNSSPQPAASI